jgi:hypothetical protein
MRSCSFRANRRLNNRFTSLSMPEELPQLIIFELSIALFVVVNGEVMYIEAITIVSKRRHP